MIGRRLFDVDAFESWVERMILQHRDRFTIQVLAPKMDRLNEQLLAARVDRELLQQSLARLEQRLRKGL